ncbi:MAG TPA: DUF2232 domain-containing protein [Alphaproteobacteria bacterium]|nr:DUF2232 domain-containing protein [Alphaproteobacteria bacterium]
MQRDVLIAVAAGLLAALLFLSSRWSIIGALVLEFFAPMPLIASGLALGLTVAIIAGACAAIAVALVTDLPALLMFAAADAVPALMIVRFALLSRQGGDGAQEWYPPGLLLVWIVALGIALFLIAALMTGFGPGGLQDRISAFLQPMRELLDQSQTGGSSADAGRMVDAIAFIIPAIVTIGWIFKLVINSMLAQRILERRGLSRRPTPVLSAMTLPSWLAGLTVAATVVALLGSGWLGFMGANIALILWVPYFLSGLAVLHAVSVNWPSRTVLLIAAYVFLVLFGWPAMVAAGVGFVEQWMGLRERFGGPGRSNERNE